MQTVILAAGEGKRVRPLSLIKPKPMFKILGKPLLQHVIETLKEARLNDFIIVIGQHSDQIKDYFGDGNRFGVNIQYTYQKEANGMANAIMTTKDLINDNFLVVNGDDIFESSLIESMIHLLKGDDAKLLLACKPVNETWKFGVLRINQDGKVRQIIEKPAQGTEPSNLGVVGTYILPQRIFNHYEKIPTSDTQHELAIQKYIDDGNPIRAVIYDDIFTSYKYPWDLFTINQHMMNKFLVKPMIDNDAIISDRAVIEGNVYIGKSVRVLENAVIKGPCYIGNNSLIGSNALVRNFSSIDADSVVGFSTEVSNSIIGDNCWFHTNYIGDSIIGDNCSFGAGAVTANFRFDEQNVKMKIENREIDSGRDKLGVIMADDCKIGVNATLSPGIKIGPNSIVGPNVFLQNDLEMNKIIFVDRESYILKENKIRITSNKKSELRERLVGK